MNLTLDGPFAYLAVLIAAFAEGEITYIAASALVARGHLDPLGVVAAGATGAAMGDQLCFYLLRGRLAGWVDRFPTIARRAQPLIARARAHSAAMVLLIRFAPGLRIAIAAACAYIGMSPLTFSPLNSLTALIWATTLMVLVAWAGPTYLSKLGLSGWSGTILMGLLVVGVFRVLGRVTRQRLEERS